MPKKTSYYEYQIFKQHSGLPDWSNKNFLVVVSIDPATKNYAIRCDKRYRDGKIELIFMDKFNISSTIKDGNNSIFLLYKDLEKYKQYWPIVDIVVIEEQLKNINFIATGIFHQTLAYFSGALIGNTNIPLIFQVHSKLKGNVLGYSKPADLKQWSVVKAKEILKQRNDEASLSIIASYRKQDDLCDVVCQVEALFIRCSYLANFYKTPVKPKINIIRPAT